MSGPTLDPRIQQAVAVVTQAKAELRAVAEVVQAECPHTFVLHQDGRSGFSTIRICPVCGLEEQGGPYESPEGFVKLRSKFACTSANVLAHRIPNGPEFKRVQYGRYLTAGDAA